MTVLGGATRWKRFLQASRSFLNRSGRKNSRKKVKKMKKEKKNKTILMYPKNQYTNLIEDKLKNAEAGHELGFKTIIIDHPYNQNASQEITRVNSWEEIYSILTSSEL